MDRRRLHDWNPALIALVVALAYATSFSGAFVFDDHGAIVDNSSFSRAATWLLPPAGTTACGRPVLNLSLAINHAIHGETLFGYHLVNLLIHLAAALVLLALVHRTLGLPRIAEPLRTAAAPLALATALLFGVHPLTTAAVTYIVQRAESLMALLYLTTILAVLRAATSRRPAPWAAAAIAACATGMATKEAMATAPAVALAYDRIFLSPSWREIWERRRPLHLSLAATWVVLAAAMASCPARGGTAGFGLAASPGAYALTQLEVIAHYLRLVVWPDPLVLDYGWAIARRPEAVLPEALAVLSLLALTAFGLFRRPRLAFLGLAFFAILAPTSSLVPIKDPIFEHRMYLPLACAVTAAVLAVRAGIACAGRRAPLLAGPAAAVAALAAAALALGATTAARNRDYRSEIAIWEDTVRKRPANARAHDALGIAHARAGDLAGALPHHSAAIRLRPDWALAHYDRGTTYLGLGRYPEAIADFTAALRLRPDPDAFNNRAIAHHALGAYDRAWADLDSMRALGGTPSPDFLARLRAHGRRAPPLPRRTPP